MCICIVSGMSLNLSNERNAYVKSGYGVIPRRNCHKIKTEQSLLKTLAQQVFNKSAGFSKKGCRSAKRHQWSPYQNCVYLANKQMSPPIGVCRICFLHCVANNTHPFFNPLTPSAINKQLR